LSNGKEDYLFDFSGEKKGKKCFFLLEIVGAILFASEEGRTFFRAFCVSGGGKRGHLLATVTMRRGGREGEKRQRMWRPRGCLCGKREKDWKTVRAKKKKRKGRHHFD